MTQPQTVVILGGGVGGVIAARELRRRLPRSHRIVELNEAGEFPIGDPTDLEAGANRCAVS